MIIVFLQTELGFSEELLSPILFADFRAFFAPNKLNLGVLGDEMTIWQDRRGKRL